MTHKSVRLDRRRFLKSSGLAGLALGAAALAPGGPVREAINTLFRRPSYTAVDLDAQLLAPMAGETVSVVLPSGRIPLIVDDVTTGSQIRSDDGKSVGTAFSVMLSGAAATPLQQGTYEIESDRVGTFPLFVVPNDINSEGGQRYEAVFSRLR